MYVLCTILLADLYLCHFARGVTRSHKLLEQFISVFQIQQCFAEILQMIIQPLRTYFRRREYEH